MMKKNLTDLLKSQEGSIIIEAAFAMPLLIMFLLVIVEVGNAYRINERVNQTANDISDLLAKVSFWIPVGSNGQVNLSGEIASENRQIMQNYVRSIAYPYNIKASVAYCTRNTNGTIKDEISTSSLSTGSTFGNIHPAAVNMVVSNNPATLCEVPTAAEVPNASCADYSLNILNKPGLVVVAGCKMKSIFGISSFFSLELNYDDDIFKKTKQARFQSDFVNQIMYP